MTNLVSIITAIHLAALSQVESGDDDAAIGHDGEVSRYQVTPVEWRREVELLRLKAESQSLPFTPLDPKNPADARIVALQIWGNRLDTFRLAYQRRPNVAELYLIWHRPGRPLAPKKRERERAERFENLVNDPHEAGSHND